MKKYILLAAIMASSSLAFADTNTNTGNNNSVTTNNGAGSGGTTTNSNNTQIKATGGKSASTSSAHSVSNAQQFQSQSQSSRSSVRSSGNSSNSYTSPRNPVSTAFAAPLTASDDTCMGSSSAGGQGVGFGLSLGTTWHDQDCVRRKDARELYNMGHRKAALALLCQSENVAAAMEAAGSECLGRDAGERADLRNSRPYRDSSDESIVYDYPTSKRW